MESVFIVIFGTYAPEEEKRYLIDIRDELRRRGYNNIKLVEDLPYKKIDQDDTPATQDLKNSLYYVERCQIALFIFTIRSAAGVHIEFTKASDLPKFCEKSILCFEVQDDIKATSILTQGLIDLNCPEGITQIEFNNLNRLKRALKGQVKNKVYKLFKK